MRESSNSIFHENPGRVSGFSLLELVIALSIIGVLATMLSPSLNLFRNRAERLICNGNLRSLHASLSSYLTDNKQWPQVPPDLEYEQMTKFWVDTLEGYGATRVVWLCPSLRRLYKEDPTKFSHNPIIHYTPAQFDEHPQAPFRWPAMPWVLEMGSLHGDGNMLIRGDGQIREVNELLREMGDQTVIKMK